MTRWWKRVAAAIAAMLGVGVACQAQVTTPSAVGAARMPEPLSYPAPPDPNLVPGPLTPQIAPSAPFMQFPERHSSAFQCEQFSLEAGFYANLGAQVLRRGRSDNVQFLYRDPRNPAIEDGQRTPLPLPLVANANDIPPNFSGGPRLTVGYLVGNWAVEASGFWIPRSETNRSFADQGKLFLPFTTTTGVPLPGFAGNNGLFNQVDTVNYSFRHELAGAELNCVSWNGGINDFHLILGARYLYLHEGLTIGVNDDGLATDGFGRSNQAFAANYRSDVTTHFGGLQIGGEYGYQVSTLPILDRLYLHGLGKAAGGVNYIQERINLTRGDGGAILGSRRNRYQAGGLFEIQGGVDIHLLEKCRLRLAYQALWLTGTTTPGTAVEFNLDRQGTASFGYKDVMYHGPVIELQMLF